ncbi:MotA/TolQ/ExbB proton channel family protein [Vibrio sinaloensis]|uniref:MotA/TolQ/ExbB proton channel family protein n=1 Tax=Photobacterium sp. (strain ATCC 43367) TaxID=379097 RepID=UPI00205ED9C5|nr:MotA/TolQ/ExbB proton channel family protein [Vibrio sinaloensis]UPQ89106.1 MotA/TolQ/ExbB proton channel family protein [Vibrio sinaloensis]
MDDIITLLNQMAQSFDWSAHLLAFMHRGGVVLWGLFVVVMLLLALALERLYCLHVELPKTSANWQTIWHQRSDKTSWYAQRILDGWLAQLQLSASSNLRLIKALVTLCPMLGLLGTVTGMINVFDAMAKYSTSDPKLMAEGISMATIPTMVGMVAALIGLFIHARLAKHARTRVRVLATQFRSEV